MTAVLDGEQLPFGRAFPAIFTPKPLAVWLVVGLLFLFALFSVGVFFDAVQPIANFSLQPNVEADSDTYWQLAGFGNRQENSNAEHTLADYGNNTLGPVGQALIFRNDFGVMLSNFGMLALILWTVGTMPEFDRGMFTLLLLLNPVLISALITLNKEIFAITGMVLFVKYMRAARFRFLIFWAAIFFSFAARWQQAAVMLMIACFESRISPVRQKPWGGLTLAMLFWTVAYMGIFLLGRNLIAGLLAQAAAGHTILILDNIQGYGGFALVMIPKILLNVLGRFSTPAYFLKDYWDENFLNWHDQIFLQVHELLISVLLFFLFFTRRLKPKDPAVYLLYMYLMLTAVNPMVNPRYEYPAYVLLALQASKFYRLRSAPKEIPLPFAGRPTESFVADATH